MRIIPKFSCALLLALGSACLCPAQSVGSRDLTISWRAPDDHVPSPSSSSCPNASSTISHDPDKIPAVTETGLKLTIAEVNPPTLNIGDDFTATVRLKNTSAANVLVPWQPDGEQVTRISPDGQAEAYEVADVTFRLKTGNKSRAPLFLESNGALFASPEDHASYARLAPGQWVDIKLSGKVVCGLPECPAHAVPDEHAILTAWWYQRVLTHKVEGCKENHGSRTVRELDSVPFPVVVQSPGSKPE